MIYNDAIRSCLQKIFYPFCGAVVLLPFFLYLKLFLFPFPPFPPLCCLAFAFPLSSIGSIYIRYCNQRRNKFFLPKRKIAGSRQCKLPRCTMVRKILVRQLRVRDYAHVYNIGQRHMPTQQDLLLLSFSQQLLGTDRHSNLNLPDQ